MTEALLLMDLQNGILDRVVDAQQWAEAAGVLVIATARSS
jgi:nicotinamidase-related amidase